MIVALLTAILVTCVSGWLMLTDLFWGSETMENIHEVAATVILVLVAGARCRSGMGIAAPS